MRRFKVKSRTQSNLFYEVDVLDDGEIKCECPAGKCNVACNHLELVRKFINREPMIPEEYDRLEEIKYA